MSSIQRLADAVLVAHLGVVAFVIGGLLATVVGNILHWRWVNRRGFRWAHLGAIAFVVIRTWFGATCPLTRLENWLRTQAGARAYEASFIEHWVSRVLFYDAPGWVFAWVYSIFGLAVLASWWRWPPAPRNGRPRPRWRRGALHSAQPGPGGLPSPPGDPERRISP